MDDNIIIELKDIKKTFANGVCIEFHGKMNIQSSCITIITGDSGIGKSTLLNILGLLDIAEKIDDDSKLTLKLNEEIIDYFSLYNKINLKSKASEVRRKYFSYLPQHGDLLHNLKAYKNLELVYKIKGVNPEDLNINSILKDELGLKDGYENSMPSELSGGEYRRVAIARSIIGNPKIIFMDEPTAFLDKTLIEKAIKLIIKLMQDQKVQSVVIVTHEYENLKKIINKNENINFQSFHLELKQDKSNKKELDGIDKKIRRINIKKRRIRKIKKEKQKIKKTKTNKNY